jgi:hypothetical protein
MAFSLVLFDPFSGINSQMEQSTSSKRVLNSIQERVEHESERILTQDDYTTPHDVDSVLKHKF